MAEGGDARGEAERAVKDLLHADRRTDTYDGVYEQSRLLVAVLAAAIGVSRCDPVASCDCGDCSALRAALSALRARAGEDDDTEDDL